MCHLSYSSSLRASFVIVLQSSKQYLYICNITDITVLIMMIKVSPDIP